ncbi:MAG: ABC transporter ATP-binding protein [Pseudomonadota bacterium]
MIQFRDVTKIVGGPGGKLVAKGINLTIPSRTPVALLGRNGAGKSTMLRMISGALPPTSGEIIRRGRISWPVGFAGSFHGDLTGIQNVRFVGRIYGVDTDELSAYVEAFAGLGAHYRKPLRTYSSGMKSRLAFGVSMGIDFDVYLVDEVTSVGDVAFRQLSSKVFKARMKDAGAVVVAHSMAMIRDLCSAGIVLENGRATYFEDLEEAVATHEANMAA